MKAYLNDQKIKEDILAQLKSHREADQIIKGKYWQNGKGCAVGCTIHSGDHTEYETRFGIPAALAHIEDKIFQGLENDKAMLWPERFMSAIPVGADLSLVQWKLLNWILTDEKVNPGINHDLVKKEVAAVAQLMDQMACGKDVAEIAASAAWSAERSARSAWSAERSARSARSAARSAVSAAWSAVSAVSAARSAVSAVRSAAWSAAWSAADSAACAAWSASYLAMSEKLIQLLKNS